MCCRGYPLSTTHKFSASVWDYDFFYDLGDDDGFGWVGVLWVAQKLDGGFGWVGILWAQCLMMGWILWVAQSLALSP